MLKTAALAAALALPVAAPALAATVILNVDAKLYSSNTGNGLATGILVNPGTTLGIFADPRGDTWSLGANDPGCTRESTADGLTKCFAPYTQDGLTALYGTLVGRIGAGDFFVIGSFFEEIMTQTGELFLYNWDSNERDNSGSIQVKISAVPLPAGGLMLMCALGTLSLLRRRRLSRA